MSDIKKEYEFTLPKGYLNPETGELHRKGVMRLATTKDELLPMRDPRVKDNPAYLTVIILSRVITELGSIEMINPHVIESLFSQDFDYLRDLYNKINRADGSAPQIKPL